MFGSGKGPEHIPRTTLHSEEIPTAANGWSGQNYTGFRNAEIYALIEAINLEIDRHKRTAMWDRQTQIYAEAVPVSGLYSPPNPYILSQWPNGVCPTAHQ